MKSIRMMHSSLNYHRKQHIFNVFKQEDDASKQQQQQQQSGYSSPFHFNAQAQQPNQQLQQSQSQSQQQQQQPESSLLDLQTSSASIAAESVLIPGSIQLSERQKSDISIRYSSPHKANKGSPTLLPAFKDLDDGWIHQFTNFSRNIQLHSPFRWTPLIQEQPTNEREFMLKMKQFRKKAIFEQSDESELIDTFIFQALKETGFDYYYDYECHSSTSNPYHGKIDFLIYNRDCSSKVPLIPILRSKKERNSLGEWDDKFNQAELIGAAMWALTNMRAVDPTIEVVRAIHTNGNAWRMIEISEKGTFEKTHLYSADGDQYAKIYRDEKAQAVALGLIRFALNQPSEQEKALKKVYDFIDERKYLTELDEDTKDKLDKMQKNYFFLPKFLREFLFGYK